MPEKHQTFLVNISIIEGRHYAWPNMNSAVIVKLENHKKCSAVKFKTDCPYYNEYFVFEFFTSLEKLIDKNITITVIKPGSALRNRKILGLTTFDIGTVWYQEEHQFYHKWAILRAPVKQSIGGTRGYLKLDICVLVKGETPKVPTIKESDEIEGNLLLPYGTTTQRQRVNFIFDIYRGFEFVKKNPLQESTSKKNEPPGHVAIEISFAGRSIKTAWRKNSSNPVWNERLVLPQLFPPLCQRFKIELLYGENTKKAVRFLNLSNIANDREDGFLPTFGPAILHFYSANNLEGYLGKVLISLHTRWLGDLAELEMQAVVPEAPTIDENAFLRYEDVVLFAAIFEVSSIERKIGDKAISLKLGCGPVSREPESGDSANAVMTPPTKPQITNETYFHLPIEETKPCLHMKLSLPDARKKMYNYNLLTKMAHNLKSRLNKIEEHFINFNDVETELLLESLDFVISAAEKYVDLISGYNFSNDPVLDQQRQKMAIKEMGLIIFLLKTVNTNDNKKKNFQKLEKIHTKIEALVDEVVEIESWPNVYLWLVSGNKRIAYFVAKPEKIIHSLVDEERGVFAGVLQTVHLRSKAESNVADFLGATCKIDVIFWMGLARHWDNFAKSLPSGFTFATDSIPRVLIAEEKCEFHCRCYIFQGRLAPGSDHSGLCDPFLQVIINRQTQQTQILKKTLNPIWNQILFFDKIVLYGSKEFILANPPGIVLEVHDQDDCGRLEFVGKTLIKPCIKLGDEVNSRPKMAWQKIANKLDIEAELLVGVDLLEDSFNENTKRNAITPIPPEIKPNIVNYRIEVVFWGVRHLKKIQMMQINKPKITVWCTNHTVSSETLVNAKQNLNFAKPVKMFEAAFAEQEEYAPPLCLRMSDCRSFGISAFAGAHITPTWYFFYKPITAEERRRRLEENLGNSAREESASFQSLIHKFYAVQKLSEEKYGSEEPKWKKIWQFLRCWRKTINEDSGDVQNLEEHEEEDSDCDWWTKFYASFDNTTRQTISLSEKYKLKIYPNELEEQPEFKGFTDTLHVFPMYKGKRTGDEAVDEANTTGILKSAIKIYQWPVEGDYVGPSGLPLETGFFQDFFLNNPVRFILRVYCVRGINLRPRDLRGRSDPYLKVILNDKVIDDQQNRVMGQVNPVFGRCFEFSGMFPQDHTLKIVVMDWDAMTANDLIGETKIDLENRYYTKHRGHCGLAQDYVTNGYAQWRDPQKPAVILENLCKRWNIPEPEYQQASVKIASKHFAPSNFTNSGDANFDRQVLALDALKNWVQIPLIGNTLVPEHVETRSLYYPSKPGIEQGKLQCWVDILPCADLPTPKLVNIAPRKPVSYELRVIVWNCDKIPLDEDDFFTGERKSDIFVKGWVVTPSKSQYTDVHYRSLSGEGNFNWRFIFPFDYLSSENRIVVTEKSSWSEEKIPCRLTLQVWDNDMFSASDFLGVLSLELSRLPRGAHFSKTCDLSLLHANAPCVNLFKIRRTRGWWPFRAVNKDNNTDVFSGAVEIELELLIKEDAEKNPVGLGRDDPQALPKPNRPDTSFSWFSSPWRGFKYLMKLHKCKIIKAIVFLLLIFVIFAGIYSFPGYSVKKILHA